MALKRLLLGKLISLEPGSPGYRVFLGVIRRYRLYLFASIICNVLAATSEGSSFGIIFLTISAISGEPLPKLPVIGNSLSNLHGTGLIVTLIAITIGLQVLRSALLYGGAVATARLSTRISTEVSLRVFQQIFSFSFSHASQYRIGNLNRYIGDSAQVINSLVAINSNLAISALTGLAYAIVLMTISVQLSVGVALLMGSVFTLQKYIIPRIRQLSRRVTAEGVKVGEKIIENIQALRLVHTFGRQDEAVANVRELKHRLIPLLDLQASYTQLVKPLNQILTTIAAGIVLILAYLLLQQTRDFVVASLFTYIAALNRLGAQIQTASQLSSTIANLVGKTERLNYILSNREKEFVRSGDRPFPGLTQGIRFNNVSLCYGKDEQPAVSELNLEMPKGSVTALVGGSGAGKSSVVDLLIGLYEPTAGQILIDGVPAQDWRMRDWRAGLGVVSQDTFIFNRSILENICYGTPDATPEDAIAAARDAQAHEFIEALPQGYDTVIGERGYRLSGGQRQRLALARAILRQPDVLILDEATSALDSHSERLIQEALERFQRERTVLVIAHRLSTIVRADRIVVMEQGCCLESGTHQELLDLKGRYAAYWKLQVTANPVNA